MHPETSSIAAVFGKCNVVIKSLDLIKGVTPADPGFKKVNINLNLGNLTNVKGTYPTPYGVIKV